MSNPGWYPDPGGQRGMFRYWDGQTWSAALSPTADARPPASAGPGLGQRPTQPIQTGNQQRLQVQPSGQPGPPGQGSSRPILWWAVGVAGVVIVVILAAVAIRSLTGIGGGTSNDPTGNSTRSVCPPPASLSPSPGVGSKNGRVHGGMLSYPTLGAPWSQPMPETRVPFGRDAWYQSILVEQYSGTQSWVASTLVAELNAGDGFYSPQDGSEIVVKCIVGAFYGDSKVDRADRVNQAYQVQGHDAWLVETHLTFNIANLKTKGELAIVLIVATSDNTSSIFYASIPDTASQYEQSARQAMADLEVG